MAQIESFSHNQIRQCVAVTGRSAGVRERVPKSSGNPKWNGTCRSFQSSNMHLRAEDAGSAPTWRDRRVLSLVVVVVISPDILLKQQITDSFSPRGPVSPHWGALLTLRVDSVCVIMQ